MHRGMYGQTWKGLTLVLSLKDHPVMHFLGGDVPEHEKAVVIRDHGAEHVHWVVLGESTTCDSHGGLQ